MSEVETSAVESGRDKVVESGLDKVAATYRDLLAERDGLTLRFYLSRNRTDMSSPCFFNLHRRDGRYWMRRQGTGGTRPHDPGPAIDEITEGWVVKEAARFI